MCIKSQFIKLYKKTFSGTENLCKENFFDALLYNPEIFHAYNCFAKLEECRKWPLHTELNQPSKDGYDKESMIFENRELPHIEYLITSMVYRFESDWNHTVVCTDNNYKYMCLMCSRIHKDIKVINLGAVEINQNSFNNILLSKKFWNNINGEKILVYQQDADIYHGNVEEFLKYDYIGPAWPKDQRDNKLQVGNGGFSLRSKSALLNCLDMIEPTELPLLEGTVKYMKGKSFLGTPMDAPPEDVYFSKTMIDYKLGNVADHDTAKRFGNECYFTKKAVGGHQYWWYNKSLFFNNVCDYSATPKLKNYILADWSWVEGEARHHVSGWPGVINSCVKHGVVTKRGSDNQLLLIDNVEKYFVWDNKPAVTREWVGITHTTPNAPPYLKVVDIETLLTNQNFVKSMSTCRGLITLSKYMQQYILNAVKKIPVTYLKHPTNLIDVPQFEQINLETICNKENLTVIQLGQQLRVMSSIYHLKYPGKKMWLTGTSDLDKMQKLLTQECAWLDKKIDIDSVEMAYVTDLETYNDLIYNNIILIDLVDASANNAILELAAAKIPFFVKKLPSIVEYIGYKYPMFFEDLSEVENILEDKQELTNRLTQSTEYLSRLDSSAFSHDIFASNLLKIANM